MSNVETAPVVSDGLCLAFGGTNARHGNISEGELFNYISEPTPDRPKAFFKWMAHNILDSAHEGASWVVAGFPGPVNQDSAGTSIGPFANIPGLKSCAYLLEQELRSADSACADIMDQGFKIIAVNDGELAAHAVAERVSQFDDKKVGALINGTGVGFGAAERGKDGIFRTVQLPLEVGHVPIDDDNPLITFESTISGTALEKLYGDPKTLDKNHPIWRTVGRRMARMAIMTSLHIRVDLIVPTGGVGVGAHAKWLPHLDEYMQDTRNFAGATTNMFRPRFEFIDASQAQTFELFGATSIVRSSL